MIKSQSFTFQYAILGESGSFQCLQDVGKTSILMRFKDKPLKKRDFTGNMEYEHISIIIDNYNISLIIWNSAGIVKYIEMVRLLYRAAAIFIVYDVTSRDSFNNVSKYVHDIEHNSLKQQIQIVLVGNKTDLESDRQVTTDEGRALAESCNLKFIETCAKSGENIHDLFMKTLEEILNKIKNKSIDLSTEVSFQNIRCGAIQTNHKVKIHQNNKRTTTAKQMLLSYKSYIDNNFHKLFKK